MIYLKIFWFPQIHYFTKTFFSTLQQIEQNQYSLDHFQNIKRMMNQSKCKSQIIRLQYLKKMAHSLNDLFPILEFLQVQFHIKNCKHHNQSNRKMRNQYVNSHWSRRYYSKHNRLNNNQSILSSAYRSIWLNLGFMYLTMRSVYCLDICILVKWISFDKPCISVNRVNGWLISTQTLYLVNPFDDSTLTEVKYISPLLSSKNTL